MIEEVQKPTKRKKTNYVSPIIAVSLLLFMFGILIHLMFQSSKWTNQLKEGQSIRVELKKDASIPTVEAALKQKNFTKEIEFVSKEKGWEEMKKNMNHDASTMLDENPLPNLFLVHIKADNHSPVQIEKYCEALKLIEGVATADFKASDVKLLDKVISKFYLFASIFILLFLLISIYIISNTIRLAIFSQRFIIRSMQLVGATRWFIVKPFVLRSLWNGLLSGLYACILISGIYAAIEYYFPHWNIFQPAYFYIASMILLILLGMLISFVFSWIMVRRYLRMKLDELF